jgi:hypothetical protein
MAQILSLLLFFAKRLKDGVRIKSQCCSWRGFVEFTAKAALLAVLLLIAWEYQSLPSRLP